jgi:glycine/D-amino acid oxidase-like deaminating enzyme
MGLASKHASALLSGADATGQPVWSAPAHAALPHIEGRQRAEVVVIGGGLTGLSTAWHLKTRAQADNVVLLEAASVGSGASGRAAGNCLELVGESAEQMVAEFGRERAAQALRYGRDALAYLESLATPLALPFSAPQAEFIEVATNSFQVRVLERRLALLESLGADGGRTWLDAAACRQRFASSPFLAAVSCRQAKLVDPPQLLERWLAQVLAAKVQIHEYSPVLDIERRGSELVVHTPRASITAGHVVVATNAFTGASLGVRRVQRPIWSYCIATAPIPDELWQQLGLTTAVSMYDTNHLLHYFRRCAGDRLLFGGGEPGVTPSTVASLQVHAAQLEAQLRRYFPPLATVARSTAWSGPISLTRDLAPALCISHDGRLMVAVGCTGHGLVAAQYNGKLLAEAIAGDREVITRFPFRAAKRWPGLGLDALALRIMRSAFRARDSWHANTT